MRRRKFYVHGLKYQKIHACLNDCVLYRDEFASLKVCPTCGLSRFKKKIDGNSGDEDKDGPPAKVMWYLPIIHKFKRLFSIKEDAKNLKWHVDGRKCDNLLRHPWWGDYPWCSSIAPVSACDD